MAGFHDTVPKGRVFKRGAVWIAAYYTRRGVPYTADYGILDRWEQEFTDWLAAVKYCLPLIALRKKC